MIKNQNKGSERFQFGKNWKSFLSVLNEDRIHEAEKSICDFLNVSDLSRKTFLDVGSGSGLFSLAARRVGATVHSFDFDIESVECAMELKRRYFPNDHKWKIQQGSVLDRRFIESLGEFDICYSWGVLHHTDSLWRAMYNVHLTVSSGGFLLIAIYNDQRIISSVWELIKKTYCSGWLGKCLTTSVFYPAFFLGGLFLDIIRLKNPKMRYENHKKYRGMSLIHDWKDWLGGYPYEPARSDRVLSFFENLNFKLVKFQPTLHGFGNNQYLFHRE